MTVSTFQQTDAATQAVNAYNANIDADFSVLTRLGDTFAPHAQASPNMTVRLDAGHIFNGTTLTEVAAQNTGTITAPVTNPRIDRVVVDRLTGAVSVATGAEAASPTPPAVPSGKLPVAQILLQTSSTTITNAMITDERDLNLAGISIAGGDIPVATQSGTNYTYVAGDKGYLVRRSNSGTAMADTLPGTGTGVMVAGWSVTIANDDASALISVAAGSGATLNGAPLGYLLLGPKQTATVTSDGTNYNVVQAPGRAKLAANTTLYVATTGSNSNTGLTAALPFLTIQYAADMVTGYLDLGNYQLTIQLADGTYTGGLSLTTPCVGGKDVRIVLNGNSGTPSNVVISTTSANAVSVKSSILKVQNLKLQTTTSGSCLVASSQGFITFTNIVFGACAGIHIYITESAQVSVVGSYSITGGAQRHVSAVWNSTFTAIQTITVTLTGTPAFSTAFAYADYASGITYYPTTFSGAATGTRYYCATNSIMASNGGGANFFPGNAPGSTAAGGQYV